MELHLKKNAAAEIMFAMVDSTTPANLKSGVSPVDTPYSRDGAGAWATLAITDTATEIGTTGMYTIELTAAEMNHDLIMIKMAVAGAADTVIIIRTFDADIDDIKTETAAILLDTAEIGAAGAGLTALGDARLANLDAAISTRLAPAGTLATVTNVGSVTGNVGGNVTGSVGSLAAQAKTDVNAEVADVINTDAATELAAIPTTTGTLRQMVQFLFQYFRNKKTVNATTETTFKEDAATSLGTAALSDDATTFTKGEMN